MAGITEIVREEVEKYATRGIGAILFATLDDDHQTYCVIAVEYPRREEYADVVVFARVVDDKVVIEEDTTDKKLVDALLQRGIPREQIILAYNGEPIPDAEKFVLD